MAKLAIFDLDNTLVITRPAAKEAYKQAINHIAKMEGRYKDNKKLYNHWKKIVSKVMGEKKPQLRRFEYSLSMLLEEQGISDAHYAQALNVYQKTLLEELKPQAGAKDLLKWLRDKEIKIAVATASGRSEAKKKLKKTGLLQYIDLLLTSDDIGSMKPHKEYVNKPMEEFAAKAKDTVVIGDNRKEDLDYADSIKATTILVTQENYHLGNLKETIH